MNTPPIHPIGEHRPSQTNTTAIRAALIRAIESLPNEVKQTFAAVPESQLDTRYRNWTIRQIVHHLADSHINSYTRFRLALTEDNPTIKPYEEGRWAELSDAKFGSIEPSMQILFGVHDRWGRLLRSLSENDFQRTFFHPETSETLTLDAALSYYAWHGRHHTGQIEWLVRENLWS